MRWKTFTSRCSKFIQETMYQISSQLPEFCRRYYRKHVGLFFSGYSVYVLPLLGYNSVVWSTQGKEDIECIERVLRRYTKRLPGLKSYPYKVRLKRLNLTTLELRRLHIDLVWCYKIDFALVDVSLTTFSHWPH